jgi:glutamate-1-semialdehyde aminotransferase
VLFQGHYHGHLEEGLVDLADGQASPVQRGLSRGVTGRVRIAQFNDPRWPRRSNPATSPWS